MKKVKITTFVAVLIYGATVFPASSQTINSVSTKPVGFVTIDITAGTGNSKKTSLISIPLLSRDTSIPSKGNVTSVKDARTISYTTVGTGDGGNSTIPAGYLSNQAEPYLLHFTSGNAEGFMLLVSTQTPNTITEITLDDPHNGALNLTSLGVNIGDEFKIYPCDTLLSFFGTPESTLIKGGTSPANADTITMTFNGSASTYYYNTNLDRWARIGLGSPNANNIPLLPFYGLQYGRLASTPLQLISVGEVPTDKRKLKLRANGTTIVSSYWPQNALLSQTPFSNSEDWRKGNTAATSDKIVVVSNGGASTFWNNGSNWKRLGLGSPTSDTVTLPLAAATLINKVTPSKVTTTLEDSAPYSF